MSFDSELSDEEPMPQERRSRLWMVAGAFVASIGVLGVAATVSVRGKVDNFLTRVKAKKYVQTDGGHACTFPFDFQDDTYNDCTYKGSNQLHWCIITDDGTMDGTGKGEADWKWDWCKDTFRQRSISGDNAAPNDPLQDEYDPIKVGEEEYTVTKVKQGLQPRIGACYVNDEKLLPVVRLWRERMPDQALQLLEEVSADADESTVTLGEHLAINIGQLHDKFDVIKANIDKILAKNSEDVHALFTRALYAAAYAMSGAERLKIFEADGSKEIDELDDASPHFASILGRVAGDAELTWAEPSPFPVIPVEDVKTMFKHPQNLIIAVFGWGPVQGSEEEGWFGLPPMEDRVETAKILADAFPDQPIVCSGGAVTSGKVEGIFIKEELIKYNAELESRIIVDPHARDSEGNAEFIGQWVSDNIDGEVTLLIVGSDWQDPRFRAIMDGVFQSMKIKATIVPVGAGVRFVEGQSLDDRIEVEKFALFRDMARARGLYDSCDFEES